MLEIQPEDAAKSGIFLKNIRIQIALTLVHPFEWRRLGGGSEMQYVSMANIPHVGHSESSDWRLRITAGDRKLLVATKSQVLG
jgi:hypothetical protein